MDKKRLTLMIPLQTHKKLKSLSSETNQSMTKILIGCIDEKYADLEKTNQSLLSKNELKFVYFKE